MKSDIPLRVSNMQRVGRILGEKQLHNILYINPIVYTCRFVWNQIYLISSLTLGHLYLRCNTCDESQHHSSVGRQSDVSINYKSPNLISLDYTSEKVISDL